jgi:hypothetical protein
MKPYLNSRTLLRMSSVIWRVKGERALPSWTEVKSSRVASLSSSTLL